MEMEQWDEGGDSYQNNENTVYDDGNNNENTVYDDGNNNYNNTNQQNHYSNQSNQSNDNNYTNDNNNFNNNYSHSHHSQHSQHSQHSHYNRGFVGRNNNNNNYNNNRRNDYRSRRGYSNRRGRGGSNNNRYRYNDSNYNNRNDYRQKRNNNQPIYKPKYAPKYVPKYAPKHPQNNNNNEYNNYNHNTSYQPQSQYNNNNNDYNNNNNNNNNNRSQTQSYQPKSRHNEHNNQSQIQSESHQQTQPTPTDSNIEISQPSNRSRQSRFKSKGKFKRTIGNDIDDIDDINDNTNNNNTNNNIQSNYNHVSNRFMDNTFNNENKKQSYEVDESKAIIRHQTIGINKPYNNNNNTPYNNRSQHRNHNLELDNLGDRPKEMALQLMKGTYDCMVCQSFIGKKARIWTCKHCYTMFHIACVNKWARAREEKKAESEFRQIKPDYEIDQLRCPACNYMEINFKFNEYKCFCTKVIFDHEHRSSYTYASSIPHSCGDICGNNRGPLCPHKCSAICHPGPCESCKLPSNRKSHCPCGKLTYSLLCGDQKETQPRLCKQICDKLLKCGNHTCQLKCHNDECKQCHIKIEQICFCGKHKKLQPCGTGIKIENESKNNDEIEWKYSCNKICNKQLSCKNHKCTLICHNGSCSGCSRRIETPTRCACGKTTISDIIRNSCLDILPVCKNKCGRMLGCGKHFCKQKCHDSKCNLCTCIIKKRCRCNASEKKFKCHDYEKRLKKFISNPNNRQQLFMDGQDSWIKCSKKCKRLKSCGKHTCSEICCRGRSIRTYFDNHQCRDVCNKLLSCGRHRCSSFCHRGNCNPCGVTYRNGVECACGAVFVPGPFQCGTKEIPECRQACDKLMRCGHYCASKCHEGVCPPCIRICSKPCIVHGLMVHNMPCHVDNRSCGNPCGRMLTCETHKCTRTCHNGDCEKLKCTQICNRPLRCGHKCMYKCHTQRCNYGMCKAQIDVKCKCGARSDKQYCKGRTEYELKAVPCTEECQIAERNKRFREALNISSNSKKDKNVNSEMKDNNDMIPYAATVLERILKWMNEQLKSTKSHTIIIKQNKNIISPKFVYYLEGVLKSYISDGSSDAKQFKSEYSDLTILISSNGNIIVNLKPMSSEQRYIVYCMVTRYHIKAEKKENGGKYGTSYIELSKTKHTQIADYLLSKALIEYQLYGDKIKTLESMPPNRIIVIDNGENVSSSLIQDRLLAWTGDYRMYRNENQQIYIVFTDINARNSAMTQMKKFGGRKANQHDSINALQFKKQRDKKKKLRLKEQQQQQKNNKNNNKNASNSKSNDQWSTVGNAHAVTIDKMAKYKPQSFNVKMNNRFG